MSMHPPSPERTSPSGPGQQRHGGFGPPEFRTQHSGFGTNALSRDRLGVGSLVFFTVSASAPMTVLAGGVVATFAVSGVIGVPLAFPILALILALFAVGYGAMSRHVVNAGVFYAYISKGLGGAWGVAASFVALISYNAIQIGLYGLFGAATGGFIDAKTGLNWSSWRGASSPWLSSRFSACSRLTSTLDYWPFCWWPKLSRSSCSMSGLSHTRPAAR